MEGCLLFCIHLQPKLHFRAFKQSRLSQSQTESDNALRAKNISLFCQLDFLSQTTEGSTWIKGGCVCVPYTETQTRKKLQIFWLSQSDWSTVFFLQTQPAASSHISHVTPWEKEPVPTLSVDLSLKSGKTAKNKSSNQHLRTAAAKRATRFGVED